MMNINASLVDQRINGILHHHADLLMQEKNLQNDVNRQKSMAFLLLCISTCLDISLGEAAELMTDGGNDGGVDGLHIGEVEDGEFLVTLFQAKYKVNDLSGEANFPENGVQKTIDTLQVLFDPYRHVTLNKKIAPKIEEVRSLIKEGNLPTLRIVLCNNGKQWNDLAAMRVAEAKQRFGDKVDFIHFNHDSIVDILQKTKKVDATLTLSGKAIIEDMNYMRVLVGRIAVQEIQKLFNTYDDRLLERNIRRYLGLHSNRVNTAIHQTLLDPKQADKFYFYNNGITVICDRFDYNAFQQSDYQVQLKNMQVVNGGQTCKTIQETLNNKFSGMAGSNSYVMVRIYQLAEANKEFVQEITYATNSQNPVDLRDLRSNDDIQKQLELGIEALGYTYKRQRDDSSSHSMIINSSSVAEASLAIWRQSPHQAKFRRKELFGKLYTEIFQSLSPAQAVLAVLIFRFVENERRRFDPETSELPSFIPYASHYLAMLIGRHLLHTQKIHLEELNHRNFSKVLQQFQQQQQSYYQQAIQDLKQALRDCYGDREISLQQLAATFRRGDLLEMLQSPQNIHL